MAQEHHHHHHHHHHETNLQGKKLLWGTLFNFAITVVQIIGGIISNSLSLISDALHNLGDASAIFIAFLAGKHSRKPANEHRTFGYKRIEILAALFNSVVLIAISIYLFFEAFQRFITPEPIKGKIMFIVAIFGLLANLISVLVLNKDKNHNLNIKAAYLHLMGDTLSSVAVILGGIGIWFYQIYWLDPLITVAVSMFIIYHTWGVVKQTVDILMQTTPSNINIDEIKSKVEKTTEIENIHHVHLWKLDDKQTHFEAHINLKNNIDMEKMMLIKQKVEHILKHHFKIQHITLQMEYDTCADNNELIKHT
ncbi:MAG TPA: cation transporter [Lutibacter sp.]|nr:cation transporter [Lutibacter sp.]